MKYITFTKHIEIQIRCRVPIVRADPSVGWMSDGTEEPELSWEFGEMTEKLIDHILDEYGESIHIEAMERWDDKSDRY